MLLYRGEEVLFHFRQRGWGVLKGSVQLAGHEIRIAPRSWWSGRMHIHRDGVQVGEIKQKWNGRMLITVQDSTGQPQEFSLLSKGFWNPDFHFLDVHDEPLIKLHPAFKWKKLSWDLEIEVVQELRSFATAELILYAAFATRLYQQRTQAAAAGAAG